MTDGRNPYEIDGIEAEDDDARIQRRAYEIWEQEGRPDGRALDHWAQAESELRAEEDERLRLAEGEISSLADTD